MQIGYEVSGQQVIKVVYKLINSVASIVHFMTFDIPGLLGVQLHKVTVWLRSKVAVCIWEARYWLECDWEAK